MDYKKKILFISVAIILLVSVFLRFYHLSQPNEQVFDEVYFPVFAHNYLTHTDFFDAHPPLGKLIIAVGIAGFGNVPLGWRIMNAVTGVILLLTVFGFTLDLTRRWQTALLALFLVAIDPMALVESRVGLINIYLALFSLLGLWMFWKWWYEEKHAFIYFLLALIFFSAATAVKWIGIGALGAALVFMIWKKFSERNRNVPRFTFAHIISLAFLPIVYLATFIPDMLRGQDLKWWHESAFGYHAHLNATHPYGAAWWTWAIVGRPIWLYFKSANNVITGIIDIGNVVTWIGGLIALAFAVYVLIKKHRAMKDQILFLVLTYLALYLPWIVISRVKFIYHYFVPVLLLLILLAVILDSYILQIKENRWFGILFLVVSLGFFLFFLPLLMGIPISQNYYDHHLWLKTWI